MGKRVHKRVVRKGTEKFDADGVKREMADEVPEQTKQHNDDVRILSELPPHWGVFDAEKE